MVSGGRDDESENIQFIEGGKERRRKESMKDVTVAENSSSSHISLSIPSPHQAPHDIIWKIAQPLMHTHIHPPPSSPPPIRPYPQALELLLCRVAHFDAPTDLLQPPHHVVQHVFQVHFHVVPYLFIIHQVPHHRFHGSDASLQPL